MDFACGCLPFYLHCKLEVWHVHSHVCQWFLGIHPAERIPQEPRCGPQTWHPWQSCPRSSVSFEIHVASLSFSNPQPQSTVKTFILNFFSTSNACHCLYFSTGQVSSQESSEHGTPSIFVSPGDQQSRVAFGISIPGNEDRNDIYFSIAASTNLKWAGIGLGNDEMDGALYLIIYSSASGKNVTISARTASGHDEPVYDPTIQLKAMAGTGITADAIMNFAGLCVNCRSWSATKNKKRDSDGDGDGGNEDKNKIDVTSEDQECIYGLASGGPMNSDDPAASINYHTRYGSFEINLKQAVSSGVAEPPNVVEALELGSSASSGSKVSEDNTTQNWVAIWHAIIMIVCFIGLLPLGVIFLRVLDRVRWHGWNQTLAAVGIIVGAGVGIYDSLRYTRVSNKLTFLLSPVARKLTQT